MDGGYPSGALIQGANGKFYGTTALGGNTHSMCGTLGCGTIFSITAGGELTMLYSFNANVPAGATSGTVKVVTPAAHFRAMSTFG